jgi:hypothetical protein
MAFFAATHLMRVIVRVNHVIERKLCNNLTIFYELAHLFKNIYRLINPVKKDSMLHIPNAIFTEYMIHLNQREIAVGHFA